MIFALGHLRIISTINKNDMAHFQQGIQSIVRLIKIIKKIFITAKAMPLCTLRNSCDVLYAGDEYAAHVIS